jgi:hypothetical protein
MAGLAVLAFAFYWFAPQRLFTNRQVNEALPTAAVSPPADMMQGQANRDQGSGGSDEESRYGESGSGDGGGGKPDVPPGPETLVEGEFRSLEHTSSGRAIVVELSDGRRFLRFENLSTSDGPDLRVYLSTVPSTGGAHAFGDGSVDLGALKGNQGDQNYAIPADVDLEGFRSAVVWCRRFAVGFAAAPLEPVL